MDLKRQRIGNLMIDLIHSQREYTGVRGIVGNCPETEKQSQKHAKVIELFNE